MVRVLRRPPAAREWPTRAAKKRSQKHKVVLESVTQEKKKLRSIISFEAKAPPGYTFIPAGNPKLTTACKETCRKNGMRVFAVTTTPHMGSHNLSQHVHRIGYHFPSAVVASVCVDLSLYLTATGKAVPFYDIGSSEKLKHSDSQASQITINTEARDVLRDLFPNIPESDQNQIIKTAFQKGQRKVGTAVELPLSRRAQLAVVAHIRHVYTDYDRLLKATSFHDARSLVEEATLAKLVEWRGDDENGKTVLEDVFREVIVISDDEDDDPDGEDDFPTADRDQSVEIVSSNPGYEEVQTRPLNYTGPSLREPLRELSDDDAPPGFRVVPDVPRRKKIDRRGFSRYQAWDRAISRYREMAAETDARKRRGWPTHYQQPLRAMGKQFREDANENSEFAGSHTMAPRRVHAAPFTGFGEKSVGSGLNKMPSPNPIVERRVSVKEASIVVPPEAYSHPRILEASEPILTLNEPYELPPQAKPPRKRNQDIPHLADAPLKRMRASRHEKPLFKQGGTADAPVFVSSLSENPDSCDSQPGRYPGGSIAYHDGVWLNLRDRALPSIEKPQSPALRPERQSPDQVNHLAERMSDGLGFRAVTPSRLPRGDIPHQGGQDNSRPLAVKRQRVVQHEPIHHEPGLFPRYGAARLVPVTASKDGYMGEPPISLGYVPARRWPTQDGSRTSSNLAAPVDSVRRQPQRFRKSHPDSTHLDSGFGGPSGRRHIDDTDTYSPQYGPPRLGAHRREPTRRFESSGASYLIPDDDALGYPAFVPADPGAYGSHHERCDLHAKGLNIPGTLEPQASSVQSVVDDRLHVSDEVHRRKQLYAEDFVRPVSLPDSGLLEPVLPRPQTNRREVYAQTRSELPDNIVLAPRPEPPGFGYRMVYSGHDNWVDASQDTVYDGDRQPTHRFERQYPSAIREAHDRIPQAAEQGGPSYVKTVKPQPHYSGLEDRAVVVQD